MMGCAETTELLDEAHRQLAPRLAAAGFELVERAVVPDAGPQWIEYRCRDRAATHLLSLTITSDSELLVEFWCAATGTRGPEVLERTRWPYTPSHEAALLALVVGAVERWLKGFADQRSPSI